MHTYAYMTTMIFYFLTSYVWGDFFNTFGNTTLEHRSKCKYNQNSSMYAWHVHQKVLEKLVVVFFAVEKWKTNAFSIQNFKPFPIRFDKQKVLGTFEENKRKERERKQEKKISVHEKLNLLFSSFFLFKPNNGKINLLKFILFFLSSKQTLKVMYFY